MYSTGTTVKLDFGAYFHYGIADGLGSVIHNSKERSKVIKESYAEFSEGKEIIVSDIAGENLEQAAINAKKDIGMPYSLMKSNCEHFVRHCHGFKVESTQIQRYMLIFLGLGIALKNNNAIIQSAAVAAAAAALLTPTEQRPLKNSVSAALGSALIVALYRV